MRQDPREARLSGDEAQNRRTPIDISFAAYQHLFEEVLSHVIAVFRNEFMNQVIVLQSLDIMNKEHPHGSFDISRSGSVHCS